MCTCVDEDGRVDPDLVEELAVGPAALAVEKESPFGGPIAHGFLTLSLMPSLISMPVQLTGMKNVVNFGSGGLQFRRPVPAGATLHARSRVVRAEKHKLGTLLTFESAIHVKDSPKPSLTYLSMILFQG
ncbi:MAG: hypothetical protein EBY65_08845 [Acidimicrobiia bacterium]|nr:hypothetical protein [Acidimicrobiia bacterium]